MGEKRKQKRYPANITIQIEDLYKQDNIVNDNVNQDIVLTDISRRGLGFKTNGELPLDFYFNAKIQIQSQKHFYAVVKIIRKEIIDSEYHYGCEFVGLADVLSVFVEDYGNSLGL